MIVEDGRRVDATGPAKRDRWTGARVQADIWRHGTRTDRRESVDLYGFHQPIPGKAKTAGMRSKNSVPIAEYEDYVNQPPYACPGDGELGFRIATL